MAAGELSVSDVVTRAPTSASSVSDGPAPSSSPTCQATTAVRQAPRASASTVATPRRRRRNHAATPASRPAPARTRAKTASSATSSSGDTSPIGTGPFSVTRKSARGASAHQSRPAGTPVRASAATIRAALRRSARTSGQPRQYADGDGATPRLRPRAGPGGASPAPSAVTGSANGAGELTAPVNNGFLAVAGPCPCCEGPGRACEAWGAQGPPSQQRD